MLGRPVNLQEAAGLVVTLFGAGGALAAGKLWVANRKLTLDARSKEQEGDLKIEEQKDQLTQELLKSALSQVAQLTLEVERLRPNTEHLYNAKQAFEYLEMILFPDSPEEKLSAERRARVFLARMKRVEEAQGTIRNEVQRQQSGSHLIERRTGAEND